jgi:UDP-N-acetylglucosamine--N-acetylmuramyl-(pentapeptide) pyrophosphoryl-undecaprenol N-acetylglucosamine transferase
MEFEVPGILIPYPYATDDHQNKNAEFFVDTVGAGIKIIEKDVKPEILQMLLQKLIETDELEKRKRAIHLYKQRPNRLSLCELVLMCLNNKRKGV